MPAQFPHIAADVKCYHCGHISGQIVGPRNRPLRITDFVPRPGYTGPEIRTGVALRCERCRGPVFLEDTTILAPAAVEMKLRARQTSPVKRSQAA